MNKLLTNGIILTSMFALSLQASEIQNPAEIIAHGTQDQIFAKIIG